MNAQVPAAHSIALAASTAERPKQYSSAKSMHKAYGHVHYASALLLSEGLQLLRTMTISRHDSK